MACPIKKFLSDCDNLSTYLDEVNRKTDYLEVELKVTLSQSERKKEPSEAVLQLREDMRKMLAEEKRKVRELREGNQHFDKFLRNMLDQVKTLYNETMEMEAYMADYGYTAPPPIDPIRFDIFREETPGSASDLPVEGCVEQKAGENILPTITVNDDPDNFELALFKLGISNDTFKLLTNMRKDEHPDATDHCAEDMSETPLKDENSEIDASEPTVGISPVRKLFQASKSPGVREKPDTQTIEISPGLYTTKRISVKEAKCELNSKSPAEDDSGEVLKISDGILKENQKIASPQIDFNFQETPKRRVDPVDNSAVDIPTLHTFNFKEFLNNNQVGNPVRSEISHQEVDPVLGCNDRKETDLAQSSAISSEPSRIQTPEFTINNDYKDFITVPETPEEIRAILARMNMN